MARSHRNTNIGLINIPLP